MARNEDGGEGGSGGENAAVPRLSSSGRLSSRPDPFLVVCRCFSFVTAVTALLCVAVNILSAVRSFKDGSDIFDGIFRCYAVVIAFVVILAETEWGFIFKFWKVLEYWAGRGMLQILYVSFLQLTHFGFVFSVAVMTRAFPNHRNPTELILLQNIASYILIGCGAVYLVSGILCIGLLKRVRQQRELTREQTREQATKDLEDLERRREELEQLLMAERV
ncbi:unnamed protein product [Linum tenue]|uniref:Golgi apparatus membrane protein TVP15 n=1 Tax=Linum tenue TaxID=586396 RepID=A0AAV0MR11_9ROSI|nr:unnamed protein product [Linum tenue]